MVIANRSPRVSRTPRERLVDRGDLPLADAGALLAGGDRGAQRVVSALPGALHAAQPLDLGVDLGLLEDQRVAGRDRLELGEADHVLADVLDLADVQAAAHELVDEPGLALDRLPHVGVERPFGDVPVDPDGRVLVALAQDSPVALGDVRWPPRNVDVVQGDRPRLGCWCRPPSSASSRRSR